MVAGTASKKGIIVSIPFSHGISYDLLFDIDGEIVKVQVKKAYGYYDKRRNKNHICVETRKRCNGNTPYSEGDFDYMIAHYPDYYDKYWILPIKLVLSYKAQIY